MERYSQLMVWKEVVPTTAKRCPWQLQSRQQGTHRNY